MSNQIVTACVVSIIYFIIRFIEMRFIVKENKPLKQLVTDTLIVFISAISAILLLEQFNLGEMMKAAPSAFVNKPDF